MLIVCFKEKYKILNIFIESFTFRVIVLLEEGRKVVISQVNNIDFVWLYNYRFNLFSGCERCTSVACQELARQIFKPGIDDPPENFRAMCSALLVGMWPIVPTMNPKAFFEFTRRLLNCPPKQLDFLATISLNMQIFVHNLLKLPIISVILLPCLNFQMWLTIFVQNTMPILAFYAYRYTWRHEN